MNDSFVIYSTGSGRVSRVVQCLSENISIQLSNGEDYVVGTVSSDGYYVTTLSGTPTIMERPLLPVTVAGMTISGVPTGATLSIDGEPYLVNDGEVELTFSLPGSYLVVIDVWPYMPWRRVYEN